MSEYQYYEFVAIDEPLTSKQMTELRAHSTRANITATSFVNDYQWGNLKGDPIDWMWRYFDAHVYFANWCDCCLYLRLPKETFDAKTLRPFETKSTFSVKGTKTHWLLSWDLAENDHYDRFAEEDGRGWMGRLTPLRDELLRGDMRPLYLGWLAAVSADFIDDETPEPAPPPGLSRLTAAQRALAEFLEIGEDLLTAAGQLDSQSVEADRNQDASRDAWIAELPAVEKTDLLGLLLAGRAQEAERQLKLRYLAWQREQQPIVETAPRCRSVAELHALAASAAETRKVQEAAQRKKREAIQQAKRETHLRTLATDFDKCWQVASKHAERGTASANEAVKCVLVDLSDAYALCASRADFERKMAEFMAAHGKGGALVRRLTEAGLWKKSSP